MRNEVSTTRLSGWIRHSMSDLILDPPANAGGTDSIMYGFVDNSPNILDLAPDSFGKRRYSIRIYHFKNRIIDQMIIHQPGACASAELAANCVLARAGKANQHHDRVLKNVTRHTVPRRPALSLLQRLSQLSSRPRRSA